MGTAVKRKKTSGESSANPTDSLSQPSHSNGATNKGDGTSVFSSASVRISVIKRPASATSSQNNSHKIEEKKIEEEDKHVTSETVLQSLCQNYGSSDEE